MPPFPILLAQLVPVQPDPSDFGWDKTIALVASIAVPLLVALARGFWKDKTDGRLANIQWAMGLAYNITNEIAKRTENKVDDKVAVAIGFFERALRQQGITPTAQETELARMQWQALHGQEKTAEALVAQGAVVSTAAPVVSP